MRSSSSMRKPVVRFPGIIVIASLFCGLLPLGASAQPASTQPAPAPPPQGTPQPPASSPKAWSSTMSRTPVPTKGCFKSTYPSTAWQTAPCGTAPPHPYPPASGPRSETVGNGNDFAAQVSGTSISSSDGSFDAVNGVTSETGGSSTPNTFSLQLNTSLFNTPACQGHAGCQGWQQFVYSNSGVAFIQYWLINYSATCPSGWNTYGSDCWRNGDNAVTVPVQTIANLAQLSLVGQVISGGVDTIIMSVGADVYSATNQDSVLDLSQGWTASEFNIVGDCCGSQASFNNGSTIVIRTSVNNGAANTPVCAATGYTGETNNLTLVQPCCPIGGTSPAIVFAESNVPGARSPCGAGSWHTDDVTATTNAPAAASDPSGYMFTAQGTQHVMYRGADNHIHELWWNGQWNTDDVTATTNAPAAAGDPSGYMFDAQGTQHVMYRGTDNDIHELWWNGQWNTDDVTQAANAPAAAGDPSGYMFEEQGTQHVMYRGTDNHIHELWWG